MYVLKLSEDNRVQSVGKAYPGVNYGNMIVVETAPDTSNGQWTEDYIYKDGEYIYKPIERPEESVSPTQLDKLEAQALYTAMMTDTLLEV